MYWKKLNYSDSKKTNGFHLKESNKKVKQRRFLRAIKLFCVILK
jgi:hypothetical protein